MVVSLSTSDFEPRQRVSAFEAAAASICKLAIEPEFEDSYTSHTTIKLMPGAVTARTSHSSSLTRRTRAMAADEADNLLIHVPLTQGFQMAQLGGQEVTCAAGQVYLDPNEVAGRAQFFAPQTEMFYISIPRAALALPARTLNGSLREAVRMTPQWRLFVGYAQMLHAEAASLGRDELGLCTAHLHELARMALSAQEDERLQMQGRGLRAARLRALKSEIDTHLVTPGMSLADIAARQGISERYARALFTDEDTTFRDYVTQRRLRLVHRMLLDPAQDHRSVSDLVMAAGFGDLSWFNKCYRQFYGETPSDSRAAAQAGR
jgi:AraC-like DNA-binding protein